MKKFVVLNKGNMFSAIACHQATHAAGSSPADVISLHLKLDGQEHLTKAAKRVAGQAGIQHVDIRIPNLQRSAPEFFMVLASLASGYGKCIFLGNLVKQERRLVEDAMDALRQADYIHQVTNTCFEQSMFEYSANFGAVDISVLCELPPLLLYASYDCEEDHAVHCGQCDSCKARRQVLAMLTGRKINEEYLVA